jgi:hypothetical protein
VLVSSSRMLAPIRLTSQLGQRGDGACCHRSSRRVAMAVVEMGMQLAEAGGGNAALSRVEAGEGMRRVGVRLLGLPGERENGPGRRRIVIFLFK